MARSQLNSIKVYESPKTHGSGVGEVGSRVGDSIAVSRKVVLQSEKSSRDNVESSYG